MKKTVATILLLLASTPPLLAQTAAPPSEAEIVEAWKLCQNHILQAPMDKTGRFQYVPHAGYENCLVVKEAFEKTSGGVAASQAKTADDEKKSRVNNIADRLKGK